MRCRIVPDCYRKNFPVQLKSHRSHDIVLLCIDCHDVAHTAAERLKRRIAASYNVPVQPSHSPPDVRPPAAAAATADADDAADVSPDAHAAGMDTAETASELATDSSAAAQDGAGAESMPGPLYIRKAALTLERQTQLPEGRRREFEGDIIR